MKRNYILSICLFLYIGLHTASAQDSAQNKKPSLSTTLQNKTFVFVATSLTPMRGTYRQLTEYYYVALRNDSLIADLPYFGRSRIAPIDPTKIGIELAVADPGYAITTRKKGGWNIKVIPKDQRSVTYLYFTIYENGRAYLDVSSYDRDPISYQGHID